MNGVPSSPNPSEREAVIERDFLAQRAHLLEVAAYLDRCDRADAGEGSPNDRRLVALREALRVTADGSAERVRRVLELWSDHSTRPRDRAPAEGVIGVSGDGGQRDDLH